MAKRVKGEGAKWDFVVPKRKGAQVVHENKTSTPEAPHSEPESASEKANRAFRAAQEVFDFAQSVGGIPMRDGDVRTFPARVANIEFYDNRVPRYDEISEDRFSYTGDIVHIDNELENPDYATQIFAHAYAPLEVGDTLENHLTALTQVAEGAPPKKLAGIEFAACVLQAMKGLTPAEIVALPLMNKYFRSTNLHIVLFPGTVAFDESDDPGVFGIGKITNVSGKVIEYRFIFYPLDARAVQGIAVLSFV